MDLPDLWQDLKQAIRLIPENWQVTAGDKSRGAYRHSTSVLALAFFPDDSVLVLAGGGALSGADGSIRLIDVSNGKNFATLHAHVCGVHDVAVDPQTGFVASASFDYAVHLWNLEDAEEKNKVLFLRGEDDKTKGHCKFSRDGSLLAMGEYAYYEGPHSFYVYDLKTQKYVFEFALPDELGVTAMALSPDSKFLAVTANDRNGMAPTRFYLVRLDSFEVVRERVFEDLDVSDLTFVEGHDRLLAGAAGGTFGDLRSGLIEFDSHTGEVHWQEDLGGITLNLACHPHATEFAVAYRDLNIRIYDARTRAVIREERVGKSVEKSGRLCSLAYSNSGDLLAYGMSNGKFGIFRLREE
jgi:WD40 repeat protein